MHRFDPRSANIPFPSVIETTHRGQQSMDVWSRLLMDRIVFIGTEINADVANVVMAQLLFLESDDPEKPINLYINSPGGDVTAGLAIYDTMQYINAPVATLCAGRAMSMGAVLLAGGEAGMRSALPHSSILIHQPLGGVRGQATDIEIHAKEILRLRKVLTQMLTDHSGQTYERVSADCERDYFMTPDEALEYGLIDQIVGKKEEA